MIALLSFMILGFMIPALIILGISKNIHKLQSKKQLLGVLVLYVFSCLLLPAVLLSNIFKVEQSIKESLGFYLLIIVFQVIVVITEKVHVTFKNQWIKAEKGD
jgi:ABC-type transport system involved in multi-copper enzyme maturation permease subunit